MEYDVNRIEFVKTQKTKYFIQTSEHIFQICIDCIVYIHLYIYFIYIAYIFKIYFFIMFCFIIIMFFIICCYFAFAELKCFCALPTLMCLLPNIL